MNEQNLIPIKDSDVARALQEKSAKKRSENCARRKSLKEELEILLELTKGDKTYQELMSLSMINQAIKGNVKAYETIRDTIGQKPVEKQEIVSDIPIIIDKVEK